MKSTDQAGIHKKCMEYANSKHSEEAKEFIIRQYTPMVRMLAMNLGNPRTIEDLIQEGFLALLKAWYAWNPNMQSTFTTYAWKSVSGLLKKSLKAQQPFLIADEEILNLIRSREESPTKRLYETELINDLYNALRNLPRKEQKVINECFGLNGHKKRTLSEIGREMGISGERVRQLREKALEKLRANLHSTIK